MMGNVNYDHLFKLLIMGDSGVGKTCLLFRFCDDAFDKTYISTIGIDFKIKTIDINGIRIKLQIWDTAGQEKFHTITKSYYRRAQGIMLVFDVTSLRTFRNVSNWIQDIEEHASEDVEKIIIGNKCDLESNRQVPSDLGKNMADGYGMKFVETSAKNNRNVDTAFRQLAEAILARVLKDPQSRPDLDAITTEDMSRRSEKNKNSRCCS